MEKNTEHSPRKTGGTFSNKQATKMDDIGINANKGVLFVIGEINEIQEKE